MSKVQRNLAMSRRISALARLVGMVSIWGFFFWLWGRVSYYNSLLTKAVPGSV
jgi:hypothetical protein